MMFFQQGVKEKRHQTPKEAIYDEAHCAFMTLPPYTRSREGGACRLRRGPNPCRVGLCVRKRSPGSSNMLAHQDMARTFLRPVFVYVTTCHQQGQRRHLWTLKSLCTSRKELTHEHDRSHQLHPTASDRRPSPHYPPRLP